MPKVIKVNRAQISAAQGLIEMYEDGVIDKPSPAIYAIAAARKPVRQPDAQAS